MTKPDFVAEFVALAREVADVSPDAGARMEAELRARYGGMRVKIGFDRVVTPDAVVGEMLKGYVVADVSRRLGVSRATIYRRLAEHKNRKTGKS